MQKEFLRFYKKNIGKNFTYFGESYKIIGFEGNSIIVHIENSSTIFGLPWYYFKANKFSKIGYWPKKELGLRWKNNDHFILFQPKMY